MITWPAMVPTVDEDRPEASSETAKTVAEACPSSGVRVWWATSIEATSLWPVALKVSAAITSMAALIRPAMPMATTMSSSSKRKTRRFWAAEAGGGGWGGGGGRERGGGLTLAPRGA